MKKYLILVLMIILNLSSAYSQWLEKEGYWELTEKIPELRDLKIIPEENLIITVSKDNTIRHIEYDSGKILKTGKPVGITEDNDYAKISSDGKTTVVARYIQRGIVQDCDYHIINNQSFEITTNDLIIYDDMFYPLGSGSYITDFKVNLAYFDYIFNKNLLLLSINYKANFDTENGRNTYFYNLGYSFTGEINDYEVKKIKILPKLMLRDIIDLGENSEYKYLLLLSESSSGGGSGNQHNSKRNYVGLLPHTCDSLFIKLNFDFLETWSDGVYKKDGYLFNLQQVFNHSQNIAYIKGNNQLYLYDILSNTFTDSVSNKFLIEKLYSTHNSKYFHLFEKVQNAESINFSTFLISNLKNVSSEIMNVKEFLLEPQFVESKNQLFIIPKDENIRYYKPDILSNISQKGFSWSKDTVEVGEEIEFTALVNIDSCEYEWEFEDGIKIQSSEKSIMYKYNSPGMKTVKLKVTTPKNEKFEFQKDTIINVWEVLKADFDVEILNSESPLKVRFTDKSRGTIISWIWDFGDGGTSNEQNPIHEYKYSGDFSPRLIVKNSITADTIFKYENILINTKEITLENSMFSLKYKSGRKPFRKVMKTSYGFCQVFEDYQKYSNSSSSGLYLDFRNYNFDIDSLNQYQILVQTSFEYSPHSPLEGQFEINTQSDGLYILCLFPTIAMDLLNYYDIFSGKLRKEVSLNWESNALSHSKFALDGKDDFLYWFTYYDYQDSVSHLVKTDIDMNIILSLPVCKNNAISYFGDNQLNNIVLLINTENYGYKFISVSKDGNITSEKSFTLDTNITLSGIKSVNENLVLLHGFYNDKVNKTTYAYYGKYHPLDNTLQDTILYSRKDIRKIERVNNSTYAAIGQSRGRQGYLLLDTNLHQIKDIRVENLTGEIKDMILHDNKVYLFTEKVVSNQTMALGANESYQTTASVLGLPDDIIANVEESPKNIVEKFTHSAYPNPASDVINLKVTTSENANYSIKFYDIYGSEILNIHEGILPAQTEKIFNIPTSQLPIGSYYYVISGGGLVDRGKMMVLR